jgi:hypothetical protein
MLQPLTLVTATNKDTTKINSGKIIATSMASIQQIKDPLLNSCLDFLSAKLVFSHRKTVEKCALSICLDFGDDGRSIFHKVFPDVDSGQFFSKAFLKAQSKKSFYQPKYIFEFAKSIGWRPPVNIFLSSSYQTRFNMVLNEFEIKKADELNYNQLSEPIINSIWQAGLHGGFNFSTSDLTKVIKSAFSPQYHPVKDIFLTLPKWDGEDHIGCYASRFLTDGKIDSDLWLRKWLVGCVANVFAEIKNQFVLILVGHQGIGKTLVLRKLTQNSQLAEFYEEKLLDVNDKDNLLKVSKKFILNLDEIGGMFKGKNHKLKSLLTSESHYIRAAYSKTEEKYERLCSFAGTSDVDNFLNDLAGSRRFVVIKCQQIDYQSPLDVGKLWAQAYALFNSGYRYWMDAEEQKIIEYNNRTFEKVNEVEELISHYLEPAKNKENFMSTTEVQEYLKERTSRVFEVNHLGQTLRKLGYQRSLKRISGHPSPKHGYFIKPVGCNYLFPEEVMEYTLENEILKK